MRAAKPGLASILATCVVAVAASGVVAQAEPPTFGEVSGTYRTDAEKDSCMGPEYTPGEPCSNGVFKSDDPRLSGTSYFLNEEIFLLDEADPTTYHVVSAATELIANDGGSWVFNTYDGFVGSPEGPGNVRFFKVYAGAGGYEGLTALIQFTKPKSRKGGRVEVSKFKGVIIDAPTPAFPSPDDILGTTAEPTEP